MPFHVSQVNARILIAKGVGIYFIDQCRNVAFERSLSQRSRTILSPDSAGIWMVMSLLHPFSIVLSFCVVNVEKILTKLFSRL